MALQRKRPIDEEDVENKAISIDRTDEKTGATLSSFSTFDEPTDIEKTTLDLDAFAPYKPAVQPSDPPREPVSLDESPVFHSFDTTDFSPIETFGDAPTVTEPTSDWSAPLIHDSLTEATLTEPTDNRLSRLFVQIGKFSANYELDAPDLVIGRPDYVTNSNPDIIIEWDDAISRQHARVYIEAGDHYIEDLGSTNGTKVNGIALTPHSPKLLQDGDIINLGSKTELSYIK